MATSVTLLPGAKVAEQVLSQPRPAGEDATSPEPCTVTLKVTVGAGGMGESVKAGTVVVPRATVTSCEAGTYPAKAAESATLPRGSPLI